jgi:hypothetical protein
VEIPVDLAVEAPGKVRILPLGREQLVKGLQVELGL